MHFVPSREQLLSFASHFAEEEGTVLLLSGGNYAAGQCSYLGLFPKKIVTVPASFQNDPWQYLEENTTDGFWFGYLSYDMGLWSLPKSSIKRRPSEQPLACFVQCGFVIKVDHANNQAEILNNDLTISEKHRLQPFLQGDFSSKPMCQSHQLKFSAPLMQESKYKQLVESALEWIRAGEVYQVNLSQVFELKGQFYPYSLYQQLMELNPQPFSAYMHFPHRTVVSLSPERFLQLKEGILESRPIKGTAPRGKNEEEDRQNLHYLLHSEKETAELLMITDLMRNDIGKASIPGTIKVPFIRTCEKYANVFHMHSVVQGQLKPDISLWKALKICFPAGSITGCPKIRAMELIDQLEERSRGIYTGAIGFIHHGKACDFNVAIRTLDIHKNRLKLHLGGGITIDSDPHKEYEETLHKGKTFFRVFGL